MKKIVTFVLLCEGSSDQPLVEHLQVLLVSRGADEANGYADWQKGSVSAKLAKLRDEGAPVDVAFVHRDADSPDAGRRIREIEKGVGEAGFTDPCLPVVPVQETEAWLLIDEAAIRSAVGNPNGTVPLGLPSPEQVEHVARPKEALAEALASASGKSGRRLAQEKKRFSERRRTLLQRLDPEGIVRRVPSWQRLERAIDELVESQGWATEYRAGSSGPASWV